jgi:hypothetical protein|eukprot:COSAG06_NODE_5178_length_3657_cov_3.391231_5_plen_77_part_00
MTEKLPKRALRKTLPSVCKKLLEAGARRFRSPRTIFLLLQLRTPRLDEALLVKILRHNSTSTSTSTSSWVMHSVRQ